MFLQTKIELFEIFFYMNCHGRGQEGSCTLTIREATTEAKPIPKANSNLINSLAKNLQGEKLNMYTEFMMSQLETGGKQLALADDFATWYAGWNWTWKVRL